MLVFSKFIDVKKRVPLKTPPHPKPPSRSPVIGDMIEWVNLLEVWSNDSWVDDGGPYFDIKFWDNDLVRRGIIIEGSLLDDVWYWTVWRWKTGEVFCVSDETDQIRLLSTDSIK